MLVAYSLRNRTFAHLLILLYLSIHLSISLYLIKFLCQCVLCLTVSLCNTMSTFLFFTLSTKYTHQHLMFCFPSYSFIILKLSTHLFIFFILCYFYIRCISYFIYVLAIEVLSNFHSVLAI